MKKKSYREKKKEKKHIYEQLKLELFVRKLISRISIHIIVFYWLVILSFPIHVGAFGL